jgi:hypothetical protein
LRPAPISYWNAAPLDEIEAFAKSKLAPADLPMLEREMERGRFNVKERAMFVPAVDAYVSTIVKPR